MFCKKKKKSHYMINKMLHNCVKLLGICWQCKLTAHYSEHRVPFWYQPAGTQTDQRYTHGWQIKASYASITHAWSPVDGPWFLRKNAIALVAYKLLQSNIITWKILTCLQTLVNRWFLVVKLESSMNAGNGDLKVKVLPFHVGCSGRAQHLLWMVVLFIVSLLLSE